MSTSQGHDFRLWYKHEDNGFNQDPADGDPKPFGYNATGDNFEGSNNAVQVFEPGSRTPADIVKRLFDGAWSVSFVYTNPWWLNALYGPPSTTDNGDGSHTHTWDGEGMQPQQIGIGRTDSGKERVLSGCICTQAQIQPSVNDFAAVTLRGAYASEEIVDPADLTPQPAVNHEAMTFIEADLALGGSSYAFVQDGTIQLTNNSRLIPAWGSATPVDFAEHSLVPEVDFNKIVDAGGTEDIQDMYGDSAATTIQDSYASEDGMTFTLDNEVAPGSGTNVLTANLADTVPNSLAESSIGDPDTDVAQQIQRLVEDVSFDATNEVSAAR